MEKKGEQTKTTCKSKLFYLWPIWKEPGSNSHPPAREGLQQKQCSGTKFAPRDKGRQLILVWRLVTWMKQILGFIPRPRKHLQKQCSNGVGHIILCKCSRSDSSDLSKWEEHSTVALLFQRGWCPAHGQGDSQCQNSITNKPLKAVY